MPQCSKRWRAGLGKDTLDGSAEAIPEFLIITMIFE